MRHNPGGGDLMRPCARMVQTAEMEKKMQSARQPRFLSTAFTGMTTEI